MPVTDLGAGPITDRTQRFVLANDSPDVEAGGATDDELASASLEDASAIALLKAVVVLHRDQLAATLRLELELRRIRVGIGALARVDLERAVPK